MSTQPAIEIEDLCITLENKPVLKHFSLSVDYGESLSVIGPSGAGKSMLLSCILGLAIPQSGRIKIHGVDVTPVAPSPTPKAPCQIGMLFQNAALFDSLKIWENVIFGLRARHKMNAKESRRKATQLLEHVGLHEDILDLYPADLSGGMQKRVGLARAIASSPEIILFDEPTTGLDPIMSSVISDLIAHISHTPHTTTLTITHDMNSARTISTKIAMLFGGRIIWQGSSDELFSTKNPYVQQFVRGDVKGPLSDHLHISALPTERAD